MKLIARVMALLSFLVMFQYANAANNSIYVDQIGDGTTISLTQTGSGNSIGSTAKRSSFNGNNNLVNIQQIGNQNAINMDVVGGGATITNTITGNSNQVDLVCDSCSASTINKQITGNGNAITMTNDGLTDTNIVIESDNNTITMTNNTSSVAGVKNEINISGGNSNQLTLDQTGTASTEGHFFKLVVTGAMNLFNVGQGGTIDSKIDTTVNGSSNTVTIKSNHQ